MNRALPFERRCALYIELDETLSSHTRFFAAAALTNALLSRLFSLLPIRTPRSYHFLNELGAMLEAANVSYAAKISRGLARGAVLDDVLVREEQSLVRVHVEAHRARGANHWHQIRRYLNGLLNRLGCASVLSRWLICHRHYCAVLTMIRNDMGIPLDFADESHRVRIGLGLIHHIRQQSLGAGSMGLSRQPAAAKARLAHETMPLGLTRC